ncbi:MAG: VOC family protein [Hyphomonadaceae bacterium]|nr:VOC family protein [Hyphomonadaceae bacterium]
MSDKILPSGLHHVGLTVENLQRSIAFYTEHFEMDVVGPWLHEGSGVGRVTGYPGCSVEQAFLRWRGTSQVIELLQYTNGGPKIDPANGNAGAAHFALLVTDLDEIYERLLRKGCRFVSPVIQTPPNPVLHARVVYLLDPDDVRIELVQLCNTPDKP